ncbi:MAG: tricorn protease [Candidatus Azotimanducaceae bacterium]|jgi:tricorn protease
MKPPYTHLKKILCSILITLLLMSSCVLAAPDTRLLRFADIHRDKVTFVYSGDIYVASISSGIATRLTSHQGFETFPRFSRSGEYIAFSAEFTGSRQVFKMKVDGSDLQQLTWYNDVGVMAPRGGYDYRVMDWSVDDKNVLVRANRLPWSRRMGRPYLVPADGGLAQPMAVPETGSGMLSPDGTKYVYTPIDREFRTWKRHRGGRAQDVWVYDLKNNTSEQLTDNPATDNLPVWVGDNIYFLSDRDYTLNLYRYEEGKEPTKISNHETYDALWAAAGPEALVYESGGYLWRYAPGDDGPARLKISVLGNPHDLMPSFKNVTKQIESMDVSADGQRAVFGARGEIFTVPAKQGEIRNITQSADHREISVSWSPDGKYIAYLSDRSGEYEIYIRDQSGEGVEQQITKGAIIWRFPPRWSPDSRQLAFADKNHVLWTLDVKTRTLRKLDQSKRNDITDYRWSPDSRWITYTKDEDNGFGSIWVYDLTKKKAYALTDKNTHEAEPVFAPGGKHLFFLSNRDYNLAFSSYEFNYLYHQATRVYAVQLTESAPVLYPFVSDEVVPAESSDDSNKKSKKEKKDPTAASTPSELKVDIDLKGFGNRVIAMPGEAGNYRNLEVNEKFAFVIKTEGDDRSLEMISLEKRENTNKVVASEVSAYRLSKNGKKVLVRKRDEYAILEAQADQKFDEGKLDLTHLTARIDPALEWRQMYVDGWRILRDWFYDANTHGTDWLVIRGKYQPMVDAATHRTDLDYILGEVAGELNAGHIYVNSGDNPQIERVANGLLGAEFKRHKSGYFEITKIFKGENWHQTLRSPLTEPGVKATTGNYIVAINGISTGSVNNIYSLLENTKGRRLAITINSVPKTEGGWVAIVEPITSETSLRYLDWVRERMEIVDRMSDGRVGYVHLPNTAVAGNRELFKQFLPQMTKDALIVDDRYNQGGFIPDRMIELLARTTMNYWKERGLAPNATPLIAHDGPKVMLINGYSSSGGDALPYYFRQKGLGKLIGTRTWGGLIGLSGNPGLADGGAVLASTFRIMNVDGKWVVENEGVSPDIEVIDRPELVFKGQDPSLERGVKELLKDLAVNPRSLIKSQAPPRK